MKSGLSPLLAAWAGALAVAGCMPPRFLALEADVAELKRGSLPASEVARISERLADLGLEVAELRAEVRELRGEIEVARHAANEALERAGGGRAPGPSSGVQGLPGGEEAAFRNPVRGPGDPQPSDVPGGASDEASGGGPAIADEWALAAGREGPGTRGAAGQGALRGTRATDERAVTDDPPVSVLATSAAEVRDYEDAFRIYRAGDFQRAIDRFEAFLQTHPSSDYADNALFWMGECYYKLGDHERAVLVFEDVVKRFPKGNKVPDALYRQGRALLEIGARRQETAAYAPAARQVFQRIVREHPESERVLEAQRELERLAP